MTFGRKLKTLRKERNLSQAKLAEISGVSKIYIAELETDKKSNPGGEKLSKLADALNVTVDDLLNDEIKSLKDEEEKFLNTLTESKRLLFNKIKNLNNEDARKVIEIIKIFEKETE